MIPLDYPPTRIAVLTRPKFGGMVAHDAVLRVTYFGSALVELHPRHGLRVRAWQDVPLEEAFEALREVPVSGFQAADHRLQSFLAQPPTYSLLDFNCQHFASFVATGRAESRELQGAGRVCREALPAVALGALAVPLLRRLAR